MSEIKTTLDTHDAVTLGRAIGFLEQLLGRCNGNHFDYNGPTMRQLQLHIDELHKIVNKAM